MKIQGDGRERLDNEKNVLNRLVDKSVIKPLHNTSNASQAKKIPVELKEIASVCAVIDRNNNRAAEAFGIYGDTIKDFRSGRSGGGAEIIDVNARERINKKADAVLHSARERALDRLVDALNEVTPEKLEKSSALEASTIAKNMAVVHEKLSPKDTGINVNGNVIFLVPKQRTEKDYETVETVAIEIR